MTAARSTEPPGRTRTTRAVRTSAPAPARHRRGSTPRAVRTSPSTMATCSPETAVRWVMDTSRMASRRSVGRAWSSPRASPGTRARVPLGQGSSPPCAAWPRSLTSPDPPGSWPAARASPARRPVTSPRTPLGGASTLKVVARTSAPSRCPAGRALSVAWSRRREPMGTSRRASRPRSVTLMVETRPSTLPTSRVVRTVSPRAPATRGCRETVPTSVTGVPRARAVLRGS